jgi:hypothetical protein
MGGWLSRLVHIAFSRPNPLVIVTSFRLAQYARVARLLFTFSPPLTAATTDHLCLALATMGGTGTDASTVSGGRATSEHARAPILHRR